MKRTLVLTLLIAVNGLLYTSCRPQQKYEADWIIVALKYQNNDLSKYLTLANLIISFDKSRGMTPSIYYNEFIDKNIAYPVNFEYERKGGSEFIKIQGSKFFTDRWEVKCINEDCCRVSLSTEEKYVELIYNSGISASNHNYDCPRPWEVVDWIKPPRNIKKKKQGQ